MFTKKRYGYYRFLYLIAAIYDFSLGISFLFFYKNIYNFLGMNIPQNPSYLTFSALMITIFGILLFMIYFDLENAKKLIILAILIKLSYIGTVVFYYLLVGADYVDMPYRIFAFLDLAFAILFFESLRYIKR
ncbi:hypothetical protein HN832_04930 [archaeon]|jgi:hypothetical protein|nr:hypothetical protein [archaeon]MBT4374032.1 hypothetical protein [archaeon]MBT4532128.1 hypothetical protein [archaeon]MBT7002018.1 hypothetical protein [archaeon]MBT7282729.1 hypothetical protein [archaeon]